MDLFEFLNGKRLSIVFIQKLFERTNIGFFAKNNKGEIISLNDFMLDIFGVGKKEEVLGKIDADFFPIHIAKAIQKDDLFVLQKGKTIFDKIEMVPFADFKTYWLRTSKYPIVDDNQKIIGLIGITSKLKESGFYSFRNKKLNLVLQYMEEHIDKKISLNRLCTIASMSKTSLLRHFKNDFQTSPMAFLKKVRLHLACKMLRDSDKDLASISYACGYYDQSHFTKDFKSVLNTTPKRYKRKFDKNM